MATLNSAFNTFGCLCMCVSNPIYDIFQMQLLFSKSHNHQTAVSKLGSSSTQSCRPYLLTLLTHRASWATLHHCLQNLLNECDQKYDPTAVLDFLWALTCNPKLWQGREKFTPKHHSAEDILGLTSAQVWLHVISHAERAVNILYFI